MTSNTAAILAAIASSLLMASPAATQGSDGAVAGRYTMQKTDDGFVRLDTQTGAVALCRKHDDRWSCQTISGTGGDPAAQPSEIERLERENAELRQEVARLEDLLGISGPNSGQPSKSQGLKLPSEKDVDQAFDYFEGMLRKFQERLKKLEPETEPGKPRPERQL